MAGQLSCALCWKPCSASLASAWQSLANSHSAPSKSALLPLLPHHHDANILYQSFFLGCMWSQHACCAQHLSDYTRRLWENSATWITRKCNSLVMGVCCRIWKSFTLGCFTGAGNCASAHMLMMVSIDLVADTKMSGGLQHFLRGFLGFGIDSEPSACICRRASLISQRSKDWQTCWQQRQKLSAFRYVLLHTISRSPEIN